MQAQRATTPGHRTRNSRPQTLHVDRLGRKLRAPRATRTPVPDLQPTNTMISTIDQAWEDMNNPETANTRAYELRVNRVLTGSTEQAKLRVPGGHGIQANQQRAEALSFDGLESKALKYTTLAFKQVQVGSPCQSVGKAGDGNLVSRGQVYQCFFGAYGN